jgi:uncharacterized membrane protein YkvA (DUF1232 family)
MRTLLTIAIATVGGLLLAWLVLVVGLVLTSRGRVPGTSAVRLLPDLLRLVGRLARDRTVPRGVRLRLWLLVAYLASPIDLIPDFIPVIGFADDVVIVALVLRSVVRRTGRDVVARHWPGTDEGLAVVLRLAS